MNHGRKTSDQSAPQLTGGCLSSRRAAFPEPAGAPVPGSAGSSFIPAGCEELLPETAGKQMRLRPQEGTSEAFPRSPFPRPGGVLGCDPPSVLGRFGPSPDRQNIN